MTSDKKFLLIRYEPDSNISRIKHWADNLHQTHSCISAGFSIERIHHEINFYPSLPMDNALYKIILRTKSTFMLKKQQNLLCTRLLQMTTPSTSVEGRRQVLRYTDVSGQGLSVRWEPKTRLHQTVQTGNWPWIQQNIVVRNREMAGCSKICRVLLENWEIEQDQQGDNPGSPKK